MAYNEEKNIARALESLLSQKLKTVKVDKIFVIASGCTDQTVPIVKRMAQTDKRIKLLIQKKRRGKSSAVNLFLNHARSRILVLTGADTIPQEDVVERLVSVFSDRRVGMSGAHPIPIDSEKTFFGFAAHLLWELHHQISLKAPKMGEMTAFRRVFKRIPYASAVDEATVEPLIVGQGYKLVYVPKAIVFNKGTESLAEFLRQRRRIHHGHLVLIKSQGYSVSTLKKGRLVSAWLRIFRFEPRFILYSPLVGLMEIWARILATYDYFKGNSHTVWEVAPSTKDVKTN